LVNRVFHLSDLFASLFLFSFIIFTTSKI
jgi:hypothetical protein